MKSEQARTNAHIYLFMIIVLIVGTYFLFPNSHREVLAWAQDLMRDAGL